MPWLRRPACFVSQLEAAAWPVLHATMPPRLLAALFCLAVIPAAAAENVKSGNLFSAIPCAKSSPGVEWARLRPVARARFPGLRLTLVEDLHITIIYLGPGWKREDLDRIRALALVRPAAPMVLMPEVVTLGGNQQVVAVELHGPSPAWGEAVTAAKAELNRLGLKKPDAYDANFRSHLTLARTGHNPPQAAEAVELAAFLAWLRAEVANDARKFALAVGPDTPVHLLLAGTNRPKDAPEYVTVEDFLQQPPEK